MALSKQNELFDEVRSSWVSASPEERVRQKVLHVLIHQRHFPKEWIVVEKEIKELPKRRIDILCYGPTLAPLLLIECKKELAASDAIDQVVGYNHFIQAPFIAVADPEGFRWGYWDKTEMTYVFHSSFPFFEELIEWTKR